MKKMTIEEKKKVKEFFEALFEGTEGYIEIRTIDHANEVKQCFYPTTDIDRLIRFCHTIIDEGRRQ